MRRSLLNWYQHQGRSLPWRGETDPYKIWISEIMLQQTQVKTVIPYYQRWLEQFPTVQSLAQADQQTVLKAWEGLGYYARGRNLHKAAQQICQQHQGEFPRQLEQVLALPGIGRTTAGGILSAAFNQPLAILDGNVKRVLARLTALPVPPKQVIKMLWAVSEALLDPQQPHDFNQAIMDLGATVCLPKQPTCLLCPWQQACYAYADHRQNQLPMRTPSAPLPVKKIGVAVIRNAAGQILIDRRLEEGLLGGLWEFPGGKIEPGETVEACIEREIREELDIAIAIDEHLITIDHAYTHFKVNLQVYLCTYGSGEPKPLESQEIRWVDLDQIDEFPFPKANQQIIQALRDRAAANR
ncbi:MAG: A/G-specific adenine glycosylase [Spirulina sp. SIO3F2]|nr:A/G-specific adenine glycosylase [Spirulina sp. SIO3F2]